MLMVLNLPKSDRSRSLPGFPAPQWFPTAPRMKSKVLSLASKGSRPWTRSHLLLQLQFLPPTNPSQVSLSLSVSLCVCVSLWQPHPKNLWFFDILCSCYVFSLFLYVFSQNISLPNIPIHIYRYPLFSWLTNTVRVTSAGEPKAELCVLYHPLPLFIHSL